MQRGLFRDNLEAIAGACSDALDRSDCGASAVPLFVVAQAVGQPHDEMDEQAIRLEAKSWLDGSLRPAILAVPEAAGSGNPEATTRACVELIRRFRERPELNP